MTEMQPPGGQLEHPAQVARSSGVRALLIVQAGWILAVMDYNLYVFALPLILGDLKISVPTAGIIFFLSMQGTVVGSLVVPLVADAFGRKRALMGTVLMYALTTGAVAFAPSAAFLTLARFFVTFATGGEQPMGQPISLKSGKLAHGDALWAFCRVD